MTVLAWILYLLVALAVAAFLLWPLLRRRPVHLNRRDAELALAREQLAEIARDRELGLIDASAARAAELEIKRRMLKLAEEGEEGEASRTRPALVVATALLVPLLGGALYLSLGRPQLQQLPWLAKELPKGPDLAAQREQQRQLMEMAARLEGELQQDPEDADRWLLLARTRMALKRHRDAANAFQQVLNLDPERPGVRAALGEALTLAGEGYVTPAAKRLFEAELARNPDDPRARFYLALAAEQAGKFREALDGYLDLGRDSTADAPWLPQLRERIRVVAMQIGESPEPLLAQVGTAAPAVQADGELDLPPEQRAMVEGMVERLRARLEDEPEDLEGWRMLARSYRVLGRREEALAIYRDLAARQPQEVEAQLDYAFALLEAEGARGGLPEEAVAAFERVLALDSEQPDALFYLGVAAFERGDREGAVRLWRRLVERLPEDDPRREQLERQLDALGS